MREAVGMSFCCIALDDRTEQFLCFFTHELTIPTSFTHCIVEA